MFFRTADDASGWSDYRKIIAAKNPNAKYDFNNLSFDLSGEGLYSQLTIPLYYYDTYNLAGIGVNSGGNPVIRVGTSQSNIHMYSFGTDGEIVIDNAYKVLSTKKMSVSGSTLTITL